MQYARVAAIAAAGFLGGNALAFTCAAAAGVRVKLPPTTLNLEHTSEPRRRAVFDSLVAADVPCKLDADGNVRFTIPTYVSVSITRVKLDEGSEEK